MNNRGFVSLKQEPYKAIGHPVYIDNKKLITDALGLPNEVRYVRSCLPSHMSYNFHSSFEGQWCCDHINDALFGLCGQYLNIWALPRHAELIQAYHTQSNSPIITNSAVFKMYRSKFRISGQNANDKTPTPKIPKQIMISLIPKPKPPNTSQWHFIHWCFVCGIMTGYPYLVSEGPITNRKSRMSQRTRIHCHQVWLVNWTTSLLM